MSSNKRRTGPLAGIRILDLTAVVFGPLATQILGDMGAQIVKVESPKGDGMRANGVSVHRGMSSIFLAVNRNKRSIVIDLKSESGRAALERMIPSFDIFVHNMRTAAIERLGFGYEQVRQMHPSVIYCAATGFGQDGPHRDRPAFDDIIQAACGLTALNGTAQQTPHYVPSLIADKTAGLALANAMLGALVCKGRTGLGQFVEVPMFETLSSFVLTEHLGGLTFEDSGQPAGYQRILGGGRRPARTADGYIAMLPYTEKHWNAFFDFVGRPDLAAKYDMSDRHQRNARIAELYADMHSITPSRTTAEWTACCEALDVPCTPIYALEELLEHPHLAAVDFFEMVEHPTEGRIRRIRPTTRFSETPLSVHCEAPTIGQHTDEILSEAGFTTDEIEAMRASGGIA